MTSKASAIHSFLERFGIPVYAESSVPDNAEFPYMTYSLVTSYWDEGQVSMPLNLWYRTESEKQPNDKAAEIAEGIGYGGRLIHCDGGSVWITRGTPWCQSVPVEDVDDMVKHRYINTNLEFFTED